MFDDAIIEMWTDQLVTKLIKVIEEEKDEVTGAISNEKLFMLGSRSVEDSAMHCDNIHTMMQYIEDLRDMEVQIAKLRK